MLVPSIDPSPYVRPPRDPDRVRSVQLVDRLFPTGLHFLELPYVEEHAESDRRLKIIEEEGLGSDLERLVGKRFVTELVAAHEHYGAVLGITVAGEAAAPKVSMLEHLRAMMQAISDYALQVLAFARLDPTHVAPAQHALAPIDAFRQAAARRSSTSAASDDAASSEPSVTDDYELPEGAPAPDSPMPALPEE